MGWEFGDNAPNDPEMNWEVEDGSKPDRIFKNNKGFHCIKGAYHTFKCDCDNPVLHDDRTDFNDGHIAVATLGE